MAFTQTQNDNLGAKLDPTNVRKNPKGFDYIEGWRVIEEANRIFGFDGWYREMVELSENTTPTTNKKGNHVVSFRARVRVTVGKIIREGIGFGSGISGDIHSAYEGATKEAETDAMKRAFMTFGYPFGLALYDKEKANVQREGEKLSKNDDARVLYTNIMEEIKSCATMGELGNYFKNVQFDIARLPDDWRKTIIQEKDDRKKELDDQTEIVPSNDILKTFEEWLSNCTNREDVEVAWDQFEPQQKDLSEAEAAQLKDMHTQAVERVTEADEPQEPTEETNSGDDVSSDEYAVETDASPPSPSPNDTASSTSDEMNDEHKGKLINLVGAMVKSVDNKGSTSMAAVTEKQKSIIATFDQTLPKPVLEIAKEIYKDGRSISQNMDDPEVGLSRTKFLGKYSGKFDVPIGVFTK